MTASIAVKKHVGGLVHALNEIAVGEKTLMRRNKRSHIGKIDYERYESTTTAGGIDKKDYFTYGPEYFFRRVERRASGFVRVCYLTMWR
jgi:hypothetical protein